MIVSGTLIATPDGNRPADALRAGDPVEVLEDGKPVAQPLRWVGRLEVDPARHPTPARVAPLRLAAGALGPGLPARDLLLSPDHAVLLDGALFQAQSLRNGASVAHVTEPGRVIYVHLELAGHGLLLAEGLPVESYLDTGNRGQFAAGRAARGLPPDLAAVPSALALAVWKERGCALLRLDTAAVVPAHAIVVEHAKALGWSLSPDPALTVFADGEAVPLARFSSELFQARLPAGTRAVRLASRYFVPADLDPRIADRRQLGLAVRGLRLGGRALPPGTFGRGWHLSEPEWRWTDGDARLSLRALAAPALLELRIAPGAVPGYWVSPPSHTMA
jgi:hypothetical protein